MKMKSSPEDARRLLASIDHETCRKGMETCWSTRADGEATAASYLWLFCWAKTGMNSDKARVAAVEAFDQLFEPPFDQAEKHIDHEWARQMRYVPDLPDHTLNEHMRL